MSSGPTSGDWKRLSDNNARRAQESVDPFLEPGEEVVALAAVRRKGRLASALKFPCLEVTPATVELPKLCVVAVSSRRFLVVANSITGDHEKQLLAAGQLDEVRAARVTPARAITEVSWTAGGTQYLLWLNGRTAEEFAQALPAT